MKDREKIAEIIKKNGTYNGRSLSFDYYVIQPDDLADALIAAGYGEVEEAKRRAFVYSREIAHLDGILKSALHRAEVAERALLYAVSKYRCDECPCIECNAEIRGSQECVDRIAKTYKKQAEKELAGGKER